MCQVHTGAYVSSLAPGKNDYNTACHPRKTTTYVLHVVSISTHTHDRRKSIGRKKNETKKKQERRKEGKRRTQKKRKRKRKEKKRKDKKSNKRQYKKRMQEKEKKKNVTLPDPRN